MIENNDFKIEEQMTIFVSSNDAYDDCWQPFFTLLRKNWKNCDLPIILNTGKRDYNFNNLNIYCPKTEKNYNKKLKWGFRFIESLKYVKTKYVLVLLEDYFIQEQVKNQNISELLKIMEVENISCLQLVERNDVLTHTTKYTGLDEVDQFAQYRFTFQISIWETAKLFKYLRKHENPWEHEHWGTKRAWILKDKFYCINKEYINKNGMPISSPPAGVIKKGKWDKKAVLNIQQSNEIIIDTSKRGFHSVINKRTISQKIANRILKFPNNLISSINYHTMRLKNTIKTFY